VLSPYMARAGPYHRGDGG